MMDSQTEGSSTPSEEGSQRTTEAIAALLQARSQRARSRGLVGGLGAGMARRLGLRWRRGLERGDAFEQLRLAGSETLELLGLAAKEERERPCDTSSSGIAAPASGGRGMAPEPMLRLERGELSRQPAHAPPQGGKLTSVLHDGSIVPWRPSRRSVVAEREIEHLLCSRFSSSHPHRPAGRSDRKSVV